jgi:Rrf2 family iron-sulfur cluster assembly transcriptional regulator
VVEVFAAVDETVDAMHKGASATGAQSGSRAQSMTNRLWESLSAHVYVFLHQTRLSDVVKNDLTPCPAVPTLFEVVDEAEVFGRLGLAGASGDAYFWKDEGDRA